MSEQILNGGVSERERLPGLIDALLGLDANGALAPHGLGGHARELLTRAAAALRDDREARSRERAAFVEGAMWLKCDVIQQRPFEGWPCGGDAEKEARKRYPIRKKVPRVVRDARGKEFMVEGGAVWGRDTPGMTWLRDGSWHINAERVRLWADLLANPYTETEE